MPIFSKSSTPVNSGPRPAPTAVTNPPKIRLHKSMPTAPRKTLWAWTIATFFGAGFLKPGPGTYASAATVALWLLGASLLHHNIPHVLIATLVALALSIALGISAATRVARESGRKDPGFVVIDEVAGQLVALIAVTPEWPHA